MKLTWFGGTTVRIHIGGAILVVDPESAPEGIDAVELVSGADAVVRAFGAERPLVDTATWKPRKAPRILDEADDLPAVETWSAGLGALLVDAVGEPPLLLIAGEAPPLGRWAETGVVTLFGDGAGLARLGLAVLADAPPRLLALAGDDAAIDTAIAALRDALGDTGLVSLEAGLAVEV